MATARTIQLTAEGKARLEDELKHLQEVKLVDLSRRIQEATSYGDVSDNSEYEDLKEERVHTEARIRELEQTLEHASVIAAGANDGTIRLGSRVTVRWDDGGDEESWILVSPEGAHPTGGRISTDSPVGHALLGSHVGDTASVHTPGGELAFTIVNVR